jgi:hypothetical protein
MPDPVPTSLDWQNIHALWNDIEQAKKTQDPAMWEQITGNVKAALRDWKDVVNKWPLIVKKYHIIKANADHQKDPEKKQAALDLLQNLREKMPANIKKAIDNKEKLVPVKFETVESLLQSLEGIRQGDWSAFAGPVKKELAHWAETTRLDQHKLRMLRTNLIERLHGIQDPEKRKSLADRIQSIQKDKADWGRQIDLSQDEGQRKRYEAYVNNLDKEISGIERRLLGAKGEETKAKLAVMIKEVEQKLMDDEAIRKELDRKGNAAKYDALMWLVTNIAHPIKVLHTQRSTIDKPLGAPYVAPKAPEQAPSQMSDDESDIELERPPKEASECRILVSLISEGKFDLAKKFWINQYGLSSGDFVQLSNGVKGRVRLVEYRSVIVDLFKNDLIQESAVRVPLYGAQPYL